MKNLNKLLMGSLLVSTSIGSNVKEINAKEIEIECIAINNLNLRKGPSTDYISVGTLNKGSKVMVLEYSKDELWAKINDNGQYLWVCSKHLTSSKEESYWIGRTSLRLNLKELPKTDSRTLLTMPQGSEIKVYEEDGIWLRVSYNKKTGYCVAQYVK